MHGIHCCRNEFELDAPPLQTISSTTLQPVASSREPRLVLSSSTNILCGMPKATTKSLTARKHHPGPKERGKAKAGPADVANATTSDPSQWRTSKLRGCDTISKTNAIKEYHLKASDLEGITFQTEETVVGGQFVRPMYIYKEQDVERRTWEKHGGPEGFDAYLAKLRERYLKKHGAHAYFPQPKTYENPRGGVYIVGKSPDSSRYSGDPYVGKSPTLLNIKSQMPLWFWIAFNKSLSAVDEQDEEAMVLGGGFFMKDKDREPPMKAALAVAKTYPPRPQEKLPSSESVDRVRAVLAEAASPPDLGPGWGSDDIPGLTFDSGYCGLGLVEEYEWSAEFLEHLFSALIQLIDELGLGSEGLEGIR